MTAANDANQSGWAAADALAGGRQTVRWVQGCRRLIPLLVYAALVSNARFLLTKTSGPLTYVLVGVGVVSALLAIKEAGQLGAAAFGRRIRLEWLTRSALVAGSVLIGLAAIEAVLHTLATVPSWLGQGDTSRSLVMPTEWERRPVQIEGAKDAYYWHGVLHVHNRRWMRLVGEFPARRAGTFRIIAVGDSLTYGYGVAAGDAYPSVLERELSGDFAVEVLNLGVSGAQSEDVHRIVRELFQSLQPDLVFYGMCLNDFLPTRVGEYATNRAYTVPMPYGDHFSRRTLTGKLLERQYDALLMRWGLRDDFLGDILKDFTGYQTRFAADVRAMNDFVRSQRLSPIVAMVLNQYPTTRGKGHQVVQAAERHLRDAGMRVIPSEYIVQNDGRNDWSVSRWEGHPNEKAHQAFAVAIAEFIAKLPELQPYRRSPTTDRHT